jgi:HK97 family phage prohead protease
VLTNFRRVPSVLWNHDPASPVGHVTGIGVVGDDLRARVRFAPEGISALADQVFSLVKAGVINAVSVGFDPIDSTPLYQVLGSATHWGIPKARQM